MSWRWGCSLQATENRRIVEINSGISALVRHLLMLGWSGSTGTGTSWSQMEFYWRPAPLDSQGSHSTCPPTTTPFLLLIQFWQFRKYQQTTIPILTLRGMEGCWQHKNSVRKGGCCCLLGLVNSKCWTWTGHLNRWDYLFKMEISKENDMYDFQPDLVSTATLFVSASVLLLYSQ